MKLTEAIETLNAHRHRGRSGWHAWEDGPAGVAAVLGDDPYEYLTEFEAIAIADRYRAVCGGLGRPAVSIA